jgi:adenosylcobyric acid synthase
LDNPAVINRLLSDYVDTDQVETLDPQAFKEEQYDKLAAHVRKHVDMERLYQILTDD